MEIDYLSQLDQSRSSSSELNSRLILHSTSSKLNEKQRNDEAWCLFIKVMGRLQVCVPHTWTITVCTMCGYVDWIFWVSFTLIRFLQKDSKMLQIFFLTLERWFTPLQSFSCACKFNLSLQFYVHFHNSTLHIKKSFCH